MDTNRWDRIIPDNVTVGCFVVTLRFNGGIISDECQGIRRDLDDFLRRDYGVCRVKILPTRFGCLGIVHGILDFRWSLFSRVFVYLGVPAGN